MLRDLLMDLLKVQQWDWGKLVIQPCGDPELLRSPVVAPDLSACRLPPGPRTSGE